jgi:hypothetical protein
MSVTRQRSIGAEWNDEAKFDEKLQHGFRISNAAGFRQRHVSLAVKGVFEDMR